LLNELASNASFETKQNLKMFFLNHITNIIGELQKEFVPMYLSLEKFEEYVRSAMVAFEIA
jgi:hypothetical protein